MAMERLSIETEQRYNNAVQRLEVLKTERDYLRKVVAALDVCRWRVSGARLKGGARINSCT